MTYLLQVLLLLYLLISDSHIVVARQILAGRMPKVPMSNPPAAPSVTRVNSSSYVAASSISHLNSSQTAINATSALPVPFYPIIDSLNYSSKVIANYEDVRSGFCAIGDDVCSFRNSNGTITEAVATNFADQCLLWDASCSGNRTSAIKEFFDIAFSDQIPADSRWNGNLLDNDCFSQDYFEMAESDCNIYNSPARLSDFNKIRGWMRTPRCVMAANEWIAMTGYPWGYVFDGGMNETQAGNAASDVEEEKIHELETGSYYDNSTAVTPSCCGICWLGAQNVDLYYWPEPSMNQSCTSIIGNSVRSLEDGATTSVYSGDGTTFTDIYWGCDATYSYPIESQPGKSSTSTNFVTTAEIQTIGSLAVKVSSFSPWSPPPCVENDASSQPSNQSLKGRDQHAKINARGHSLIVPSSITQVDGLSASILVSGDFTL